MLCKSMSADVSLGGAVLAQLGVWCGELETARGPLDSDAVGSPCSSCSEDRSLGVGRYCSHRSACT